MSTYQNIFCPYKSTKPEFYSRQNIKKLKGHDLYTHTHVVKPTVVSKPCKTPPIKSFLRHQSSKVLAELSSASLQMHASHPRGPWRAEGSCATTSLGELRLSLIRLCLTWSRQEALCSTQYTAAHPAAEGCCLPRGNLSSANTNPAQMCTTAKLSYIFWYTLWWLMNMRLKPNSGMTTHVNFCYSEVSKCHLPWTQSKVTEQLSTRFSCTSVKNWNYRAKQAFGWFRNFWLE